MILTKNVSKWFGALRAVQDVSFEVPAGQVVGLLGPNGAGKTTTLRMITGYIPPSLGSVSVCGHDTITDSIAARGSIGYLPESAPLYPEMRVRDYLSYRARLFGMVRPERGPAIARVLDRCWLADVAHRRIGQLSKGYRQRVGLAGALLHDPPVLILDEPTSGLDPAQIRETRSLIRDLSHRRTVVVSSHILPEVEKTCDRVIVIARGRVRADGSPEQLLAGLRESSPYIVEVHASAEADAREALSRLGVVTVTKEGTGVSDENDLWTTFSLGAPPGAPDLRESIAASLAKAAIAPRELRRESPTLEQLFLSIIEADETGTPGRAGGLAPVGRPGGSS